MSPKTKNENRIPQSRDLADPNDWTEELAAAEFAISALRQVVQLTRADDPQNEQMLWRRHYERLWNMKRQLDAVVM